MQLLAFTFKLVTTPQLYFPSLFFLLSSFPYLFILSCMYFFISSFRSLLEVNGECQQVIAKMRRKEKLTVGEKMHSESFDLQQFSFDHLWRCFVSINV